MQFYCSLPWKQSPLNMVGLTSELNSHWIALFDTDPVYLQLHASKSDYSSFSEGKFRQRANLAGHRLEATIPLASHGGSTRSMHFCASLPEGTTRAFRQESPILTHTFLSCSRAGKISSGERCPFCLCVAKVLQTPPFLPTFEQRQLW